MHHTHIHIQSYCIAIWKTFLSFIHLHIQQICIKYLLHTEIVLSLPCSALLEGRDYGLFILKHWKKLVMGQINSTWNGPYPSSFILFKMSYFVRVMELGVVDFLVNIITNFLYNSLMLYNLPQSDPGRRIRYNTLHSRIKIYTHNTPIFNDSRGKFLKGFIKPSTKRDYRILFSSSVKIHSLLHQVAYLFVKN